MELSAYDFSTLRGGTFTLSRGHADGEAPILLVAPPDRERRAGRDLGGEPGRQQFVGDLLGGAVDQPLAKLGELAADLGLDIIAQQGTAILFGERHGGARRKGWRYPAEL